MSHTQPSGAQRMFGDFAPTLVRYTDDVLFGDAWTRRELSPRDRSLATVAALTTSGNTEQLVYHLGLGQGERPDRRRTDRGNHPPGLLRRLTQGHVRDGRRQASLSPRGLTSEPTETTAHAVARPTHGAGD